MRSITLRVLKRSWQNHFSLAVKPAGVKIYMNKASAIFEEYFLVFAVLPTISVTIYFWCLTFTMVYRQFTLEIEFIFAFSSPPPPLTLTYQSPLHTIELSPVFGVVVAVVDDDVAARLKLKFILERNGC